MLFHSVAFFVFFAITVSLLLVLRKHSTQKNVLLVASTIFYMWWNPAFIALIAYSTIIDYRIALRLERTESERTRKALLLISLVSNLALLAFFKYSGFLQDNLLFAFRQFGYQPNWADLNIILPVGISFYTFEALSYTIDVYRRRIEPCRSFRDFSLFITFFPKLVAGPIVRAADFLPQLERPAKMRFDRGAFFLFLRGLVKKVIIADGVAGFADVVFRDPTGWNSLVIWMGALCFYVQIYCDFSGYSEMAIAVARMLGYELSPNFDRPYFAGNPSEFWRKWHISLSTWLRDYLYIPLGGNRSGPLRSMWNLMLTMLIGGLWHGASWNFVLWGGLHGMALIVHRIWTTVTVRFRERAAHNVFYIVASVLAMQYFVLLTWIPFRITNTSHMLVALRKFVFVDFSLHLTDMGLGKLSPFSTAMLLVLFFALHAYSKWRGGLDIQLSRMRLGAAAAVCIVTGMLLFLLWPSSEAAFIYFQF